MAQTQIEADTAATKRDQERLVRESMAAPAGGNVVAGAMGGATRPAVSMNLFFPPNLSVTAGTTVTWVNNTPEPHTLAFGTPPAPTGAAYWGGPSQPSGSDFIPGGNVFSGHLDITDPNFATSYSLRFNTPGMYLYVCTVHPGMAGLVTVTQ